MNVPPDFDLTYPPTPTVEENHPRNLTGWVVLWLLVGLMTITQLNAYFGRESTPESRYTDAVTKLRVAVNTKEGFGSEFGKTAIGSTFAEVASQVAKDSTKDPIAARIFAAAVSEQGKPIPDDVLKTLNKSKEPRDPVFAEVFGSAKLSAERTKEIEKKLKNGGYISKLATAQAFEKSGNKAKRDALLAGIPGWYKIGVIGMACTAGIFGFCLLVAYISLKTQQRLPSLGLPLENISLPDADRLATRCAQIFCLFLFVPLIVGTILTSIPGLDDSIAGRNVISLASHATLIVAVLFLFKFAINGKRFSLASIGITAKNLGTNILWGVGAAIANLPIVLVASIIGQLLFSLLPKAEHPVNVQLQTQGDLFTTISVLLLASVGAPILEEIMFRGTLLPALARVMRRPVAAILLQGLVFAVIHPTGVPAWLPLATIGAMSGFLSRQTGSLVPSMVMHGVHNFGTLLVAKAAIGWLGF